MSGVQVVYAAAEDSQSKRSRACLQACIHAYLYASIMNAFDVEAVTRVSCRWRD